MSNTRRRQGGKEGRRQGREDKKKEGREEVGKEGRKKGEKNCFGQWQLLKTDMNKMNEIGNIQNKNLKGHLSKHINVNMRVFQNKKKNPKNKNKQTKKLVEAV